MLPVAGRLISPPIPANLPRSCEEWWSARTNRTRLPVAGRNVTIDLDGGGPMKAMTVVCKMMKDDMGVDVLQCLTVRRFNGGFSLADQKMSQWDDGTTAQSSALQNESPKT
ncbi:hypothetical protein Y032_0081g1405 [Ancylostoma ceylanicum]|uniref:Uncharacterized protein n=1 Tax=Ancylostoma ceylanicum TaxID=53326 RepID=A0A016TSY5_9BILA|nr:hypothetical protein Y032_0081g1405 [Ancylostoma ceylanicum]